MYTHLTHTHKYIAYTPCMQMGGVLVVPWCCVAQYKYVEGGREGRVWANGLLFSVAQKFLFMLAHG